jgi:hypothetical protein
MPPQQAHRLLDLVDDIHDFIAHSNPPFAIRKIGRHLGNPAPDVKSRPA